MNIVFFDVQGWEIDFLKKQLKGNTLSFFSEELNTRSAEKAKDADVVSVFVHSHVDRHILQKMPNLRLITVRATGYDNIDLEECAKRNIVVCNVPKYGENTVAEHTFALILALSRNIHKAYMRTLRNDYTLEGLEGFDLKGKTIGIIGLGSIGTHVLRMAKGFEMNVLVNSLHEDAALANSLGFLYVPLKELLGTSDIITLHVPLTNETHHLINKKSIKLIKKGAMLINTSRGALIETEALIEALDKKTLSAVGLDVIEGEDLLKEEHEMLYDKRKRKQLMEITRDHILLKKDNVIFTPHIGFYSKEALQRILETSAENIVAYGKRTPQNVIKRV